MNNQMINSGRTNRRFNRRLVCGILLVVVVLLAVVGTGSYFYSTMMESYIEVPAYITDVRTMSRRIGKSNTTEYEYTVHYSYDGEEYEKTLKSDFTPDEDLSYVWMDPETHNISEGSKDNYRLGGYFFWGLSGIALLACIIMLIVMRDKKF